MNNKQADIINPMNGISIILPARNEAKSLALLLPRIQTLFPEAEIVVVDDGSEDNTASICNVPDITYVRLPNSHGNGAAIKAGARVAKGDIFIFMDADGQHRAEDITGLLNGLEEGYDMVVGSRGKSYNSSMIRYLGNKFYNILASWVTGHRIIDLTSGFRAINAAKFLDFLSILPNGFSAPTTITMAFFRAGYSVKYLPVDVKKDVGESHINIFKDGIRFVLIIFRITVLYSPLKIFFPLSVFFFTSGVIYYIYTYLTQERFTNMSALLLTTSVLIFLIGLLAEQITFLIYMQSRNK